MQIGLELLVGQKPLTQKWGRCGLLCNQASVDSNLVHASTICQDILGARLVALFSPQHGLDATVQDNMIETPHSIHLPTGLPVYSLYSETREPTESMLTNLDTIIIDLQLVGCRVYTFKWTILACLRAAKKWQKKVVILDRPNPLGGVVLEGRVLDLGCKSFVGEASIPMRHGLTVAEFARYMNQNIGSDLEHVSIQDWKPTDLWSDLRRPWILTSPNLPQFSSVTFYPGMVVFEGTNVSEGRGTCLPFEQMGSPFIRDAYRFVSQLREKISGSGVFFRPAYFQPTSGKWQGQTCGGIHLIAKDLHSIRSYRLALAILKILLENYSDQFTWKQPPYEYDFINLPINLILGSKEVVSTLQEKDINDSFWNAGLNEYRKDVASILLYDRQMHID